MPDVAPHPSIVNPETETAMTTTALKRISTSVLLADEDALYGLRTIEGYKPPNEDYTLELLRKGEVVGCVTTARDTIQGGEVEFLGALE